METDRVKLSKAMVSLLDLVSRLRGPGGCPWDARQTDATIKLYLLEEAYEVLEAIEAGSPPDVCQELGDLLFQLLFLAQLAAERGEFDFLDVVEGITEKMIRRHPHVFGEKRVESAEEVKENWARIKREEKKEAAGEEAGVLKSVPVNLPALLRAHHMTERASRMGFERAGGGCIGTGLAARVERLEEAMSGGDEKTLGESIGALLFEIADISRRCGLNAEELLRTANRKFQERFERMEKILSSSGIDPEGATSEQKRRAWDEAEE